jgi:RHS repeat-associated protein
MSFKAILHVSGQNIVLDYVDLDLNQSVDARSRPASLTRGGIITVEFDTPSDGDMIADWAANPVKQLDGSITFMNQNQDSVMKTINFYNAYCIEFMERFDGTMSSSNMKTTIKISPERVNIGGVEHDNNWFVHGTGRGAGAKAVSVSSSSIASKEGTEFEKGTVVEFKKKESANIAQPKSASNNSQAPRKVCSTNKCTVTGHPVDVIGGYVFTEADDFEVNGIIPITWTRKWTSFSKHNGSLGSGWHHSYDMAVFALEDDMFFRGADGRVIKLPKTAEGQTSFEREERFFVTRNKEEYRIRTTENLFYCFKTGIGEMKLSSIEDFNKFKIEFLYNTAGHLEKIIDSIGRTLQISCDNAGRILKITAPHPDRVSKNITLITYEYDEFGDLVALSDTLEQKATFEYRNHLLIRETFKDGLSFYFDYQGIGENSTCTRTWGDKGIYDHKLQYFPDEKRTIVTNSLGHQTTYFGNDSGLVTKTIDPRGGVTTKVFNKYNEIIEITDPLGNKTFLEYDAYGNNVGIKSPDDSSARITFNENFLPISARDEVGGIWAWSYDNHMNLVTRQEPMDNAVKYEYQDGLLTKIINPDGTEDKLAYDEVKNLRHFVTEGDNISSYLYDNLGNCTKITDPLGNEEWREYDLLNRVTKVKSPDGNLRVFEYDAADNVIRAKDQHQDIRFEYEGMSKMVRQKLDKSELRFFYDTEGNLTSLLNEKGEKYAYQLDNVGDVIAEIGFDGLTRQYKRNLVGQIIEQVRPSGQSTHYQYDKSGRITNVQFGDGTQEYFLYRPDGALMQAANQFGKVEFTRNIAGQILSETQNGQTVFTEYDFLGNRNKVTSSMGANLNLQRDKMGGITQMNQKDWTVDFIRNKAGLETERLMGNLKSSFQRDKMGRITEHKVSVGGDSKRTKSYKWGYNDRLHEILDNKLGLTSFEHDIFGNLASANYGNGKKQLRNPDEVGNLFKTEGRTDRKYDRGGRLLEADGTNYEYDLDGNLSKKALPDGSIWSYEWNASGLLAKVIRPDNEEVSFEYDALGRRIKKTFKDISTFWVWDEDVPLHEWTNEQEVTTWLFEEDSFAPIGKLKAEEKYNIISDYLGTPFEMYDQSGGRVWQGELDSFGAIQNFKGNAKTDCPFRYQGQYEDAETGLYYNRFRYYSPEEGLYLSQDPIGLSGGFELYGYVHDVTGWVDILGLGRAKQTQRDNGKGTGRWKRKTTKSGNPFKKPGPKPYGEGDHNAKIAQIIRREKRKKGVTHIGGGSKTEIIIDTPGGFKDERRMDASFERANGERYHINVGRTLQDGKTGIIRERQALKDVLDEGIEVTFEGYGKDSDYRPGGCEYDK